MSPVSMNWKSTAAVSGATLLATWLGWSPTPQRAIPPVETEASRAAGASDIQSQADRLRTRVRTELEYRDPTRNPFRFGPRQTAAATRQLQGVVERPAASATPVIPLFPFSLSGMATETADGTALRTAILSTASDVIFVKEGDQLGTLTVTRVDETGVTMTDTDGSVHRLVLTP